MSPKLKLLGQYTLAFLWVLAIAITFSIHAGDSQPPAPIPTLKPVPAGRTPAQLEQAYGSIFQTLCLYYYRPEAVPSLLGWKDKYAGKLKSEAEFDAAVKALVGSLGDQWTTYES